jgi:hypothetical protein
MMLGHMTLSGILPAKGKRMFGGAPAPRIASRA